MGVHITFVSFILYSCILSKNVHVHEPNLAMAAIVSDVKRVLRCLQSDLTKLS